MTWGRPHRFGGTDSQTEFYLVLASWILPPFLIAGIWKTVAWKKGFSFPFIVGWLVGSMKANWEKGIFRLWLAFAVVWWIVVGILGIVLYDGEGDSTIISFYLGLVLPPLVIAGIWKSVVWIKEGFEADKPPINEDKEDNKE